jgi:Ca2+-binding EF-hand superfamily protein
MEIADVDGSGTIDPAEFHDFIGKLDESATAEGSKTVFDTIDTDGDG